MAKWFVILRVVTGKKLDPGSQAMQDLSWLVALRNRLAHFKSKIITVEEIKESDLLWHEDAERALDTVRWVVVSLLKRVDAKAERGKRDTSCIVLTSVECIGWHSTVPRIARLCAAGYPNPIPQRGSNKETVFFDDEDRRSFIEALQRYRNK